MKFNCCSGNEISSLNIFIKNIQVFYFGVLSSILELNDEQLKNIPFSVRAPLEELLRVFLARFGSCLWTAILISLGGKTKAPFSAIEEELNLLRQKLIALVNEELGKQTLEL